MARIPLLDPDDPSIDAEARDRLLRSRERLGGDINYFLALANSVEALDAVTAFNKAAYFGRHIDPRLTELAYLTASVTNRCHY
jgi:alkylhydroperoxidase family enzyme